MRRSIIVAALFCAYLPAYPIVSRWVGEPVRPIGVVVFLAAGWLMGMRAGLALGLLVGALNMMFDNVVLGMSGAVAIGAGVPGMLIAGLTGGLIGRLRQMLDSRAAQLEQSRKTEEALRESESRWRAVVDNAPYFIAVIAPDGTMTFVNHVTPGYTRERVIGSNVRDYVPPEGRAEMDERLRRIFEKGESVEADVVVAAPDGSRLISHAKYNPIFHEGRAAAAVLIAYDVTDVRQAADMRGRFLEKLVQAQEKERSRIARELHDGVGQALTSMLMGLRLLEDDGAAEQHATKLGELRALTRQTLDDLGRLSRGLHPAVLDDVGLIAAIERHVQETQVIHGISIDLQIVGVQEARLPPDVELALYRIVQETLHNVLRHANARCASVILERQGDMIRLVVEDDGTGCTLDATSGLPPNAGLGLVGMRERAQQLGGSMAMESCATGTTLYVRIPVVNDRNVVQMALPKLK